MGLILGNNVPLVVHFHHHLLRGAYVARERLQTVRWRLAQHVGHVNRAQNVDGVAQEEPGNQPSPRVRANALPLGVREQVLHF